MHTLRDGLRVGRVGEARIEIPSRPPDRQGSALRETSMHAQWNLRGRLSGPACDTAQMLHRRYLR